ncbi:TrkH family potassium uptake protein [Desulfoferula mesophila]|uniref:Trk system potassium transporter TrkH n=1 Tax=Desulfoferula mesophila TaxID=3058419 RepID=A0AAU9EXF0_9BACT|nr:Trk system potassium transporter TrkH [Desulfoferula mesophilus]
MGLAVVLSLLGVLCMGVGLFMLLPLGVALLYGENTWHAFAGGAFASLVLGAVLFWLFRDKDTREMNHRQGMAIVGISWAVAGLLGALPFYLSGEFAGFGDAVFESVSGFTTTGASVLTNVEGCSKGVLFWRALTHWLGGMGFIVLSVAILPFVGVGGMQLFKAEVPSPTPDRLAPRITDTASVLWKVYAVITAAEVALLMLGGMDWFDATCHAFATMATGGFSTKNTSIAAFNSSYIEVIVTIFMILAGMNFTLHFQMMWQRRWSAWWRNEEWRTYMYLWLGAALVGAMALAFISQYGVWESIRLAAFQSATILTTTGFATADYCLWPAVAVAPLVVLMFIGGSAGSTGGGPKVMRLMVVAKQIQAELKRLVHPRVVAPVRLEHHSLDRGIVASVWGFLGAYFFCFVLVALLLTAMDLDLTTSFSASIACLGNIGPGLGSVGPAGNYSQIPLLGKWLLSLAMIVGRLEVYTVLILFLPEFWRD